MDKRYFSDKIVKWYLENKRTLPWRDTRDPYKIWLSEIILQQTRVSQGLPYYERFIESYPTVQQLARAPEQKVLRLWQGLGYYTRARNLHRCAQQITSEHKGKFPTTYADLIKLPGIGDYTAAAIASFAFKEPTAVVDGNVFRVLSRLYGDDTPINSPEGKKVFTTLANELISRKQPDLHNQAIMEFGATFCTPKSPACHECIFKKSCVAFLHGIQNELPVKLKQKGVRKRYFYYIVWQHGDSLVMKKREERDIWNGLFDFHLIEKPRITKTTTLLTEERIGADIKSGEVVEVSKNYKHNLTHQTIFSKFIIVKTDGKKKPYPENHSLYSLNEIAQLPKPVLVSRFLTDHYLL